MVDLDVRDIQGRLSSMVLATPIGILTTLAITYVLPTRDHFPWGCVRGTGWVVEGGNPTLMIVGAFAIALAVYTLLEHQRRVRPGVPPGS